MKIHKEGFTTLFFTMLFVIASVVLINVIDNSQSWVHYLFYFLLGILFLVVLQFFRSPVRIADVNSQSIICPADGKVVVVEKTVEKEYFGDERIQVSVFMSPVNVHVNWYPLGGVVAYFKYHPGKYLFAWNPKSSTDNERTTVVVKDNEIGEVLIRQIAGALARRIVCYGKEREGVIQGTEMGFIKFGSRVDLFLPLHAQVLVKPGDKVTGNKTVIATL